MMGPTMLEDNGNKNSKKVYVMYNPKTGVTIESTPDYVLAWMRRGFEVYEIKEKENS